MSAQGQKRNDLNWLTIQKWGYKLDQDAKKDDRQEIDYDPEKGWDFTEMPVADRPRFSGKVKDTEGNSMSVKDAEIQNAHIDPTTGKMIGNLVGEGTMYSGENAGKKMPIDQAQEIEISEQQLDNSLNKKKYIRTFQGRPFKRVSPSEAAQNKAAVGGATKLTGKIDPSTLEAGKSYEVNGKTYKWNGTKLVSQ